MNSAHFSNLLSKHTGLEEKLASESRRPLPDAKLIADIKKQKLRLKDALLSH